VEVGLVGRGRVIGATQLNAFDLRDRAFIPRRGVSWPGPLAYQAGQHTRHRDHRHLHSTGHSLAPLRVGQTPGDKLRSDAYVRS
jgi:hypothetical protein